MGRSICYHNGHPELGGYECESARYAFLVLVLFIDNSVLVAIIAAVCTSARWYGAPWCFVGASHHLVACDVAYNGWYSLTGRVVGLCRVQVLCWKIDMLCS